MESVTGAPKHTARQGIADLEPEPRGAYTGAMGLVSPCAGADLSVVIRTFEVAGERLELGVGGGLTADSVPIREWYECLHKARPLVRAAGGRLADGLDVEPAHPGADLTAHGVFESLLVVDGRPIRLEAHLARLDASCRELYGLGLPEPLSQTIRRRVAASEPLPRVALRVTARPSADGTLATEVDVRPLGARLEACALVRQDRPARTWRHKWVDRVGQTAAEEADAPALPYFTDRAGSDRVAETSRGNLFLLGTDGIWRTPPLDESVLPGVTRREVLDLFAEHGVAVRVARCSVVDLYAARSAFWTSSLSGAVAITAVDGHPLAPAHSVHTLLTKLHRPASARR